MVIRTQRPSANSRPRAPEAVPASVAATPPGVGEASEAAKAKATAIPDATGGEAAEFDRRAGDALPPNTIYLSAEKRRAHIEQSILADHAAVLAENPDGLRDKLEKLSTSPFVFFRGTAGLFYRDVVNMDRDRPRVLISGDVHPENFGVLAGEDGKLKFALNDFDEATLGPFSWDIKRGATGFSLAARSLGLSPKKEEKVIRKFVKGYLDALNDFKKDDDENTHVFDEDNTPAVVRDVLDKADEVKRKNFLKKRVNLDEGRFLATDEIEPIPARVGEFQEALNTYLAHGDGEHDAEHFVVKDVAVKTGSGTASVGLERYYVLIEGKDRDNDDDVILELKEERESVVSNFVPQNPLQFRLQAARVVEAQEVHAEGANPYFGHTELGGKSFLVRERSPFKARVDISELSPKEMANYAEVCGAALAQAHARSDHDSGYLRAGSPKNAERAILASIDEESFVGEIYGFADTMATRVELDHGMFNRLLHDGAFEPQS